MEFKHPIFVRLFGSKSKESAEEAILEQQLPEEEKVLSPQPSPVGVAIDLPVDHALYQLYDLRVSQSGQLSRPQLFLEGCEDLSREEQRRELGRIGSMITEASVSRLKEAATKPPEASEISGDQENFGDQENSGDQEIPPVEMDAHPLVFVANNKMAAWLMVLPPLGNGKELDRELLDNALKEQGVAYGIDEELLDRLPGDQKRYFHIFPVAKGKTAHHGKDGYIEEFFARSIERKFVVDEHDRVDYTSLNLFQSVEKGGIICQAIEPTAGEPGRTVLDQEIPAKDGKAVSLNKGMNTELSEDGSRLLASQDGHVEYSGQGFQVRSALEIAENVDYSTGNINYMGDVHIRGNVCGGFSVRAMGNIRVDGVVESGSVDAGGDLVVAKGIVGSSRSIIRARKNVYARYLENTIVHAGGNLHADCIVNSSVYCDGEIQVHSGRGIIIGGKIRASRKVSAKVIGSKMESQTAIYLGGLPSAEYEINHLRMEVEEYDNEMEKLERQPDSPNKIQRMSKLRFDQSVGRMKLAQIEKDWEASKKKLENQGGARLECEIAYPGMLLTIGEVSCRLDNETSMCHARLVGDEILFL